MEQNNEISRGEIAEVLRGKSIDTEQDVEYVADELYKWLRSLDDNKPTIDAVPVVRCYDCKNWGTGAAGEIERIKRCKLAGYMVTMSGYCVYGEKNED